MDTTNLGVLRSVQDAIVRFGEQCHKRTCGHVLDYRENLAP